MYRLIYSGPINPQEFQNTFVGITQYSHLIASALQKLPKKFLYRLSLLMIALLGGFTVHGRDMSLVEIQAILVGKDVVISGLLAENIITNASFLRDWYYVEGDDKIGFKKSKGIAPRPPSSFKGRRAIVVSVQENRLLSQEPRVGKMDVFGKPISAADVVDPYLDVIVRMIDDSSYLGTTGYFTSMMNKNVLLASEIEKFQTTLNRALATIQGKTLYTVGYTWLSPADTTLSELSDMLTRRANADTSIPNLSPLKVIESKYLDTEVAVLVKLELPDGSNRVVYGDVKDYFVDYEYQRNLFERMNLRLIDNIPKKISAKEIAAIKKSEIFRGMTDEALYYSWGYPEKINDWGRGGKQLIFPRGQNVYLEGKIIRDWQSVR